MKQHMEIVALRTAFAMLVVKLDEQGAISKTEFADLLRTEADYSEQETPPQHQGIPRHDLIMWRGLADLLHAPLPTRWTPVVIDGGRTGK